MEDWANARPLSIYSIRTKLVVRVGAEQTCRITIVSSGRKVEIKRKRPVWPDGVLVARLCMLVVFAERRKDARFYTL